MTITKIHYSVLVSLGDYNNERLGFIKEVKPDENLEAAFQELRDLAKQCGNPKLRDLYNLQAEARAELNRLERKLEAKTQEWNAMAEFLRTQGIKADAKNMPQFTNLLSPAIEEEDSSVIEPDVDDITF